MPVDQGLSPSMGYEPQSKHHPTLPGITTPRKSASGDTPSSSYSRDHLRRSEIHNNHSPLTLQKNNLNNLGPLDLPSQESSARTPTLYATENHLHGSSDTTFGADHSTTSKRDSYRENEQFIQLQQRDHQTRAKQRRESLYATTFLNNNNNNNNSSSNNNNNNNNNTNGVNHNSSGHSNNNNNHSSGVEEPRQSSKPHSRPASPHLPSGIPQPRTKSRSGIPSTPTAEHRGRPTPPPRSRSRTSAGSSGTTITESTPQQPQMPRQFSGEYPSSLRKSLIMTDDSLLLRPEQHRSPVSSNPGSKSGTPLPPTADTIPVPIANMTKHLNSLELKDSASKVSFATPAEPPTSAPAAIPRQSYSGASGASNPNRRSIVFDIPTTPARTTGNGNGSSDANTGRMKDVGVMVSSTKERSSTVSGGSNQSGSIRKRGKTLSAMDPPKAKPAPATLPPMYMSTTSRTPMSSRAAGSMIPSPSGSARGGTITPRDISHKSSSRVHVLESIPQDVKTIRGGVGSGISTPTASGSSKSATTGTTTTTTTSIADKPKPTRSFSSGLLSGLSRRRSTVVDAFPIPTLSDSTATAKYATSSSKVTSGSSSTRVSTTLKTPTGELRASSARSSPSNHQKNSSITSPTSPYSGPLYGSAPAAEPKSPRMPATGTSPFPPLSPYAALKLYAPYLSMYERAEINDYSQVYYVGQNCRHKKPASVEASNSNFGFDDERGDYLVVNHDHLMYRYEILDMLGKGSFGQVAKCYDHKTGEYVAIKIIRNKKRFHCQAVVEVKILENLNKWDPEAKHNLIRMTDHFYFRNHLCIATELLSMNLYEFIKSNSFRGFSLGLIKRFCTQLLQSLELLSKHRVVHCDLKPENVLLKHPTKSSIKVIDFGSSCLENEKVYTYIQSRFYRSPEVILGLSYNMAIDMWSLGCILAELYTGYPLFPGENEQEQLACIMEIQG
ncbi:hypothetical protein BGZ65_012527, partial [Modicella reniformis]